MPSTYLPNADESDLIIHEQQSEARQILRSRSPLPTQNHTKNNKTRYTERALQNGRNWTRTSDPYDVNVVL